MTTSTKFTLTVLNAEEGRLSVVIPEENAPIRLNDDGEEERDHGNADWPSDAEVAALASDRLGRPVTVRYVDAADDLLEAIYEATST